jgi:PDDEXK-like uncharacterized protein DUF3799
MSLKLSKLSPSIVPNFPVSDYLTLGNEFSRGDIRRVMSRSELMTFLDCPRRWVSGYREEGETASTIWGSLVDCLLLTPEKFDEQYAVCPETYLSTPKKKGDEPEAKKWNKNATFCQEWEASQDGKEVISSRLLSNAQAAVKRIMNDEMLSEFVDDSYKSVLVRAEWHDRETGLVVPIKCLLDILPNDGKSLADLKTCQNAKEKEWVQHLERYNYHVQAALFLDAYNVASGEDRLEFRHIVQENFAPFEYVPRTLSTSFLELGRAKYRAALQTYCRCIAEGNFHGYTSRNTYKGWQIVEPTKWMADSSNEFIPDMKPPVQEEELNRDEVTP